MLRLEARGIKVERIVVPIIYADCDICGKVLNADQIFTDDGTVYCEKCKCKAELEDAREEFYDLKVWLRSTHFKKLVDLKKVILALCEKYDSL